MIKSLTELLNDAEQLISKKEGCNDLSQQILLAANKQFGQDYGNHEFQTTLATARKLRTLTNKWDIKYSLIEEGPILSSNKDDVDTLEVKAYLVAKRDMFLNGKKVKTTYGTTLLFDTIQGFIHNVNGNAIMTHKLFNDPDPSKREWKRHNDTNKYTIDKVLESQVFNELRGPNSHVYVISSEEYLVKDPNCIENSGELGFCLEYDEESSFVNSFDKHYRTVVESLASNLFSIEKKKIGSVGGQRRL